MKTQCTFFLLFLAFLPGAVLAQITPGAPGNFITTWQTDNPGTSNDNQIRIPTFGSGYNYDVYWQNTSNPTAGLMREKPDYSTPIWMGPEGRVGRPSTRC